jgi:hypothetical protein
MQQLLLCSVINYPSTLSLPIVTAYEQWLLSHSELPRRISLPYLRVANLVKLPVNPLAAIQVC